MTFWTRTKILAQRGDTKLRTPYWQNFIVGILLGLTGGLYVALNLLGAAGGRPNSASTINTANALLCAVYAVSSLLGGTVLNRLGPAWTAFFGVLGYIMYIGSLWFFDQHGNAAFPLFAAVCIGTSAGFIYVTQGYVSMSYSEENERGAFVTLTLNFQSIGSAIGGLIPLIINRDRNEAAGVPPSVYITFIAMDFVGAAMAFLLAQPHRVIRKDGTNVAALKPRTFMEELKGTAMAYADWKLWLMTIAFLPGQVFLVYCGSINVFHNTLRARSLLSFCAVVIQVFTGFILQWILDHPKMQRRSRTLAGICFTGIPLVASWIWQTVVAKGYDRTNPPEPVDWNDPSFASTFVLFVLTWVFSSLWQYICLFLLGCFTNNPRNAANNAGAFRCWCSVGEAIAFGVDARLMEYIIQSSVILGFYAAGLFAFIYLAIFHVENTKYFQEEEVTIPEHIKKEHQQENLDGRDGGESALDSDQASKNNVAQVHKA